MANAASSAARHSGRNANHHLWNNHGTWWCHFTVHLQDYTKQRLRLALGTQDKDEARSLRDALLRLFGPLVARQNHHAQPPICP